MRWPSALVLVAALAAGARADDSAPDDRVARVKTVERTIELVAARDRELRTRVAARVRAYVEVERAGLARLWVEPGGRMDFLARRAAMTRVLRRDLRELAVLEEERAAAVTARERLHGELAAPQPEPPAARSLVRPIARARVRAGFGVRRHPESRADLSARGIELAARPGDPVMAVAAGRVMWTGPLGALTAVLVDHGAFVSVLVGLGRVGVAIGQTVTAGQVLGDAAGDQLHVEIRLRSGAFGNPVDPEPLLAR